jgi:hypothetical protein
VATADRPRRSLRSTENMAIPLPETKRCRVATSRARTREIKPHTIRMDRVPLRDIRRERMLYPVSERELPETRAECIDAPRPCPYVSCQYHLYLDVSEHTGSIQFNFPDLDVSEMKESCALDVADREGATLEEVGEYMNVTRERIRQLEVKALAKVELRGRKILDGHPGGPVGKRKLPVVEE